MIKLQVRANSDSLSLVSYTRSSDRQKTCLLHSFNGGTYRNLTINLNIPFFFLQLIVLEEFKLYNLLIKNLKIVILELLLKKNISQILKVTETRIQFKNLYSNLFSHFRFFPESLGGQSDEQYKIH